MKILVVAILLLNLHLVNAQSDVEELVKKVKAKYEKVTDYEASGKMKTNVLFIKVPIANVKIYYKKPNKLKIKNENGVSFIPKGTINVNMNNVLSMKNYQVIEAGNELVDGTPVTVVKILPEEDTEDVVLSKLYIDTKNLLVLKSITTTKENGTYEISMQYGEHADYGLPKKVKFSFNAKGYKLPKGITFDYDNGAAKSDFDKAENKKGKVEITYSAYTINKGVKDEVFK
jgi:outer membrane lipoprotein-sorting protein